MEAEPTKLALICRGAPFSGPGLPDVSHGVPARVGPWTDAARLARTRHTCVRMEADSDVSQIGDWGTPKGLPFHQLTWKLTGRF